MKFVDIAEKYLTKNPSYILIVQMLLEQRKAWDARNRMIQAQGRIQRRQRIRHMRRLRAVRNRAQRNIERTKNK